MAKIVTGKIVNLKMAKTAVVEVETSTTHPLYRKIIRSTIKYKAHYEGTNLKIGDVVKIQEVRPISKTKNWIVIK